VEESKCSPEAEQAPCWKVILPFQHPHVNPSVGWDSSNCPTGHALTFFFWQHKLWNSKLPLGRKVCACWSLSNAQACLYHSLWFQLWVLEPTGVWLQSLALGTCGKRSEGGVGGVLLWRILETVPASVSFCVRTRD
jgi:hypothetical protein